MVELVNRLAIPGLPDWSGLVLLGMLAVFGAAFLLMPFSVFGLKGRLEILEAQLDEIQAELRTLSVREQPQGRRISPDEGWAEPPIGPRIARTEAEAPSPAPPIPPPPAWPSARGRTEPRIDWPRSGR
ncbi:hypothetical protein C8P66_11591 [Humitalea rosea]|uniref:Uncharacterized protein n=1 Tax=Humitalea rosea TaxID=990373 RepID=A0A2W7I9P4_9PROT|nr:hypothetical protein [Humitalea rosea]PZW43626.1 hypothetical protein C8P66_11591 [Humitalea rosea]